MLKKLKNTGFLITIVFIITSCANIAKPSGGKRDRIAPQIKESLPENFSTNFKEKKIIIKFDEFIKLANVNQSLIISPSLPEKPKIVAKGKTLIIDINNKLQDSTTYAFNFGGSITDITEGNANKNFKFVFSTGDYIDSLLIEGKIINSFDLKEEEDVYVLLYNKLEDSIPYNEQPVYVTKTNESGGFILTNLKKGGYKIFALKDVNNNYKFDMPNEKIAFLDTLIFPYANYIEKIDTIRLDTNLQDSINTDSIVDNSTVLFYPRDIVMYLFEEDNSKQYIADYEREYRGKCMFVFNKTLKDSVTIKPNNLLINNENFIIETNTTKDTVIYWITDSSVYNQDTLNFIVSYYKKDSIEQYFLNSDTILLKFKPIRKKKKTETQDTVLLFQTSIVNGNTIGLNKDIVFSFETPLSAIDTSKLKLYELVDSVENLISYNFFKDSLQLRKYHINHNWDEEKMYKLYSYANVFTDIFNKSNNDTLEIGFTVEKAENYGNLKLHIINVKEDVIIQFLDSKSTKLQEFYISKDLNILIPYLYPEKYEIKIIFDSNSNKEWTTGHYLKHIQPERVMFSKEEINIRANWDLEIDIDLNIKNIKPD